MQGWSVLARCHADESPALAQALADQGNAPADHKANLRRLEEIKEPLRVGKTCKIDKDGRRHYTIRTIQCQDPQQEAERLKAVHEARVKIVPRV